MTTTGPERVLHTDLPAERAALAACLVSPEATAEVVDAVEPEAFWDPQHRMIFEAVRDLFLNGEGVDYLLVCRYLGARVADAGGSAYIAGLVEGLPDVANAAHYARLVQEAYRSRRLTMLLQQLSAAASGDVSADEIIERLSVAAAELSEQAGGEQGAVEAWEAVGAELERLRGERLQTSNAPIAIGLVKLDEITGGLRRGQLDVLAARTTVGKSALAVQVAGQAALAGRSVAVFSLEMSAGEVAGRIIAQQTGIALRRVSTGRLDFARGGGAGGEWPTVEAMRDRLHASRFLIVDRGCETVSAIRARCRARQLRKGLDLVVVDYLQLVRPEHRGSTRAEEVGTITTSLKALARDLHVPVLALSQLNRQPEMRGGDRGPAGGVLSRGEPRLYDLRESGSIENDADIVLLLNRRVEGTWEEVRTATAIVGKNRGGPTGRCALRFEPEITKFRDGVQS